MREVARLRIVDEASASAPLLHGPLDLFASLCRRAPSDHCTVPQDELAAEFNVTTRSIYNWTQRLQQTGCVTVRRQGNGPLEYTLLRSLQGAQDALQASGPTSASPVLRSTGTSGDLSEPERPRARDTSSSSSSALPIPSTDVPLVSSGDPASGAVPLAMGLSSAGVLTKLGIQSTGPLLDALGQLDEHQRLRVFHSATAYHARPPG